MEKTFAIRKNYRITGDAQVIGEELGRLCNENAGELTPSVVVEAAQPETSPLHEYFEWDNSEAAKLYRETQARYLIRSVSVRYIKKDEDKERECRAFVSIATHEDESITHCYSPVDVLNEDEAKRASALGDLRRMASAMIRTVREVEDYLGCFGEELVETLEKVEALLA